MAAPLVRDFVTREVPVLEEDASVAAALLAVEDSPIDIAIVRPASDGPVAVLAEQQLRDADTQLRVSDLVAEQRSLPPVVEADLPLDAVVERLAKVFFLDPDLAGALVEAESGKWAVLPRSIIVEHANQLTTRSTTDRLEGAPIDVLVVECQSDNERKVIAYYDPANPPHCSRGHVMTVVD